MLAMPMEVNSEERELVGNGQRYELEARDSQKHIPYFEEILQDIDDAIHNEPMIPISKHVDPKISANQSVSCYNLVDIAVMEANRVWEDQTQDLNGKLMNMDVGDVIKNVAFKVGWAEMGLEGVNNKTKPIKSGSKGKQKLRPTSGLVLT